MKHSKLEIQNSPLPRYDRYKDSGVEWLGDVPEHWEVERVFSAFNERVETGHAADELPNLNITIGRGVQVEEFEGARKKRLIEDLNAYKRAKKGDIAYNTMRMWQGAVGDVPVDGLVSPAYVVARPIKPINSRFYSYLFRTEMFQAETNRHSYGIVSDRNRLYWLGFKNIVLPIPSLAEQDRIVAFLDRKTAEIDTLIAKKQRQIELLDEQRAILINRAVTRGLNPNAKLKPSGIEWIGDIPEHWEVKSAKHACERIIDCKNRTPEVVPNGRYYVLRTSNVKKGLLVSDEITRTNLKHFEIWTERGAPQKDDVLFTREAPAGEACLFDGSIPACLGQRMMYFRTDPTQLLPQFLVHTIYQGPSATYIVLKTNGSTVGHLRLPQVYALPILLPPVEEQMQILGAIAANEEAEKKLIQTIQSQILSLQTLRSTLIAHAVTGRIKV